MISALQRQRAPIPSIIKDFAFCTVTNPKPVLHLKYLEVQCTSAFFLRMTFIFHQIVIRNRQPLLQSLRVSPCSFMFLATSDPSMDPSCCQRRGRCHRSTVSCSLPLPSLRAGTTDFRLSSTRGGAGGHHPSAPHTEPALAAGGAPTRSRARNRRLLRKQADARTGDGGRPDGGCPRGRPHAGRGVRGQGGLGGRHGEGACHDQSLAALRSFK